jgi:STAS-like domain of unknown function (DUF4325)
VRIILGPAADTFTYDGGIALRHQVEPFVREGQAVEVGFEGTGALAASFLNGFLWDLFDSYGMAHTRGLLRLTGLSLSQRDFLLSYFAIYDRAQVEKALV